MYLAHFSVLHSDEQRKVVGSGRIQKLLSFSPIRRIDAHFRFGHEIVFGAKN